MGRNLDRNQRTQAHRAQVCMSELHKVFVKWQGEQKSLADLTPDECDAIVEHCLGKQRAGELMQGIGAWDRYSRFYCFNELLQRRQLQKVLA